MIPVKQQRHYNSIYILYKLHKEITQEPKFDQLAFFYWHNQIKEQDESSNFYYIVCNGH